MKLIFSFLLLSAVFAVPAAAQNICSGAPADAPALSNLKLGMSPAEVQRVLGKDLKIKNKRSSEYTFFQNFIEKPAPVSLAGVRAIYLRFFSGSLYQIEIFYEGETRRAAAAETLENFINQQSAKLNLPVAGWKIEYGIARINCGDFSLEADNFLNPRLQLTDEINLRNVKTKRGKD